MNMFFRLSLNSSLRSSYIYYFTFISDDAEEKKNTEIKENHQHTSSSVEEKIKKNTIIFNDKMTASLRLNNFRKFEKDNSESSKNCISSLTSKAFNSVKSILKTTLKRSYNFKPSSSKFNKQTKSVERFKNQFNYKDLHREHLTKFKKNAHMYNVFKALFINDHINFLNIKIFNLLTLTKS